MSYHSLLQYCCFVPLLCVWHSCTAFLPAVGKLKTYSWICFLCFLKLICKCSSYCRARIFNRISCVHFCLLSDWLKWDLLGRKNQLHVSNPIYTAPLEAFLDRWMSTHEPVFLVLYIPLILLVNLLNHFSCTYIIHTSLIFFCPLFAGVAVQPAVLSWWLAHNVLKSILYSGLFNQFPLVLINLSLSRS